jgi:glutamyl-tRNA reductase
VYAVADVPGEARTTMFRQLCRHRGVEPASVEAALYTYAEGDAVRHAFRVASSLDSMVIGEPQILGQVKDAFALAQSCESVGPALHSLFTQAFAVAKKVRTETEIARHAVSVSFAAVELAKKIFGGLEGKAVLLVGAGKMSELAARHLVRGGARATVLGGRTFDKAEQLAAALGGKAAPFESLRSELTRADIVISGTGAQGIVIKKEDVEAACAGRRQRPLFLIDIAVPRDVDPAAAKLPGVFLYDLDDLKSVSEANLRERRKEASAAEGLVELEVHEFLVWRQSLEVVPLLVELRQRADEMRRAEVEKVKKRLGTITPEQEQALEAVTTAIVNKLLHPPTVHIKEIASNGHAKEHMGLIRKLFGL